MRPTKTLLAALLWAVLAGMAAAASGTALGVDPSAEAERGNERLVLTAGTDVFIGDRVVTGPKGQVQIRFSDDTELVIGPNSALVIEDYLLREDGSAGRLALNALNGTFRFVTGNAAKDRYTIKTPTGTIGVRGTGFDFFVAKILTSVLLYHGAVVLCDLANHCVELTNVCDVGQYAQNEALLVGHADQISGADRLLLRQMFLYAVSQQSLMRDFWITGAHRCVNRVPETGAPDSIIGLPDSPGTPTKRVKPPVLN